MALRDTTWVLFDTGGVPDTNSAIRYDKATITSYEHYQDVDFRQRGISSPGNEPYGNIFTREVDRKKYKWVALTEDAATNAMDFKSATPKHRWEVDIDNAIIRSRVLNLEVDETDLWTFDTTFGTWP